MPPRKASGRTSTTRKSRRKNVAHHDEFEVLLARTARYFKVREGKAGRSAQKSAG